MGRGSLAGDHGWGQRQVTTCLGEYIHRNSQEGINKDMWAQTPARRDCLKKWLLSVRQMAAEIKHGEVALQLKILFPHFLLGELAL